MKSLHVGANRLVSDRAVSVEPFVYSGKAEKIK